jgi:cytoskeletal protein CcmA (bactofilin family)
MTQKTLKIISGALLLVVVFTLILVPNGSAQSIIYGDSIPAGQTVTQNVILLGNNVTINGNVDGDVIAIGSNVTVNGDISGSLVTGAQIIDINGAVNGSTYAASLTLDLKEEALIGRDVYYIGTQLIMQPGSTIERDLLTIALGATLGGEVGRDTRAIIGPIEIVNAILKATQGKTLRDIFPLRGSSSSLPAPVAAHLLPAAVQPSLAYVSARHPQYSSDLHFVSQPASRNASLAVLAPQPQDTPPTSGIDTEQVVDWLLGRLRALVTFLAIGGLVMLIFRRWFDRWAEQVRSAPLAATGWGLVVLVFGFSAAILLGILILPLAILFFSLSLTGLGTVTLSLGYFGLGLAFTIFWIFVAYVSKVIVVYWFGKWILEKLAPRAARYRFLSLLLGALIYVLVNAIPILGWIIGILVTLLGMGAVWMVLKNRTKPETAAPAELELAPPIVLESPPAE